MTLPKMEAVEKLREIRERSAFVELESSNRGRDLAQAAAASFEERLDIQTQHLRSQESEFYEQVIGNPVSLGDLEKMRSGVDSKDAEIGELAQRCSEARNVAASACDAARQARLKHAEVLRAHQKWLALLKHEVERVQKLAIHREELTLEDGIGHRPKQR
jgi:hypothetical protein